MVKKGELSYGHARTLLGINDTKEITDLAKKIIDKKYSVREVKKNVKKYSEKIEKKTKKK